MMGVASTSVESDRSGASAEFGWPTSVATALTIGLAAAGCGRGEENHSAAVTASAESAPTQAAASASSASPIIASNKQHPVPSAAVNQNGAEHDDHGDAGAAARPEPGSACPNAEAAMARAHKAASAGRWEDAIASYDAAIRARPADPQARGERGYAYFKRGAPARARADLFDALTLTRKRELMAQLWFNLGLVAKAMGNASEQRLSFAIARHHGSTAARAELEGVSSCAATWRVLPPGEIPVAYGWDELGEKRALVNCPLEEVGKKRKLTARERACGYCGATESEVGDACEQDLPPWRIDSGYLHFHSFSFYIAPLSGNAFYYANTADGLGPPKYRLAGDLLVLEDAARPEGTLGPEAARSLSGGFRNVDDAVVQNLKAWSDEMDWTGEWQLDGGAGCLPDLTSEVELPEETGAQGGSPLFPDMAVPVTTRWISLRERRTLFELSAYVNGISATVKDGVAKVRGGGCDTDVPLVSGGAPTSTPPTAPQPDAP